MPEVGKLVELEKLNLGETAITDKGIAHLAALSKLNVLLLGKTKLTDHGLETIVQLKNIKTLQLSDKITNEGVKLLPELTGLEELYLRGCNNITDDSIEELAKLRGLKYLQLSATGISRDGNKRIKKLLPDCEIY